MWYWRIWLIFAEICFSLFLWRRIFKDDVFQAQFIQCINGNGERKSVIVWKLVNTSYFGGSSVEKRMRIVGVGRFCWKISGRGSSLLKNRWDWFVFVKTGWELVVFHQKYLGGGFFVKKWVGVSRYCQNKGRRVLFLSNNEWEWVVFLKNGWEWVTFF